MTEKEKSKIVSYSYIIIIFLFVISAVYISYAFKLTMNTEVWFWFFSSIAQTFAALVALVGIFLLSRLESYSALINKNMDIMRTLIQEFTPDDDIYDYLTSDELLIKTVDKLIKGINKTKLKSLIKTIDKTEFNLKDFRFFLIIRARNDIDRLEQKKKQANNLMRGSLIFSVIIIMLSIYLIPLGSPKSEDSFFINLTNYPLLKWVFIYAVVGLCMVSLVKIINALGHFLSEN